MNHNRINWVFIILFLCINAFLGRLLYQSQWKETSISEETVEHVVSVLEKRNVQIEDSVIPRTNQSMREVSVKNIVVDSSSFVTDLEESGWKKEKNGFSRKKETFVFDEGGFTYTGGFSLEKNLSGEELSDEVQKQLRKISLNTKGIKLKTIEQIENGTRLEYVQTYENREIFGTKLSVLVKGTRIIKVSGVWTETVDIQSKKQDTLFATEALIQFAEEKGAASPVRITEVQSGYYISALGEGIPHKVMQMVPCYQITIASGEKFYYDARSPQE